MVTLEPLDPVAHRDAVVAFLTHNAFPFHSGGTPTASEVLDRLDGEGWTHAWWVRTDQGERVGIARLDDIGVDVVPDETPLFDLRLGEGHRGRGIGRLALRALTDQVFTQFPVRRFEGCTREDNLAMRRVLTACGWVKEAHHREAWPVTGAEPMDAVNYAVLRRDWESGTITPVRFDDLPTWRSGVTDLEDRDEPQDGSCTRRASPG
ncbi:GNAT family N-acetyltransferase [Brachybacterium sp. AOP25-B2-12]|uniref:GNAT family N-acetyltransferase n=1 Tax=Brachybacterium sp. AOP25-B2-12 TaxID=3457710 RepID=UPI004033475C